MMFTKEKLYSIFSFISKKLHPIFQITFKISVISIFIILSIFFILFIQTTYNSKYYFDKYTNQQWTSTDSSINSSDLIFLQFKVVDKWSFEDYFDTWIPSYHISGILTIKKPNPNFDKIRKSEFEDYDSISISFLDKESIIIEEDVFLDVKGVVDGNVNDEEEEIKLFFTGDVNLEKLDISTGFMYKLY